MPEAQTPGIPRARIRIGPWDAATMVVAGVFAAPVLAVGGLALSPAGDIWAHLIDTVLGRYIANTLLVMAGVGAGTLVTGVGKWRDVTYLLGFESLAERERLIAEFSSHQGGRTYGGKITEFVTEIETRLLIPAPFAL